MKTRCLLGFAACFLALGADDPPKPKLSMTSAVACAKIKGLGDYTELDEPALTRDDKLLVYYEPKDYAYETVGKEYRVHLTQDGRIHRRGEKAVLQSKDKLLDYKANSKQPPRNNVYLSNTISLKELPPGEYDLEIILRDELTKGSAATQVLKFRVKAAEAPSGK